VFQLSRDTFVAAVENVDPHSFVLVHLAHRTLAPSKRMSVCLHEIAREFPSLKVCEIVSTDAIPGFDEIALPALIVYKAKEVYTTFMRVTDEIGFAFEAADVISVLVKAEVVSE